MQIKWKPLLLTLFSLSIVFSYPHVSLAACAHSSLGPQYSDAEHPHAYYRQCASCGTKVYTGGYATKAHGDGSWGSGTCPSCGTHSYVGRSCTSPGVCACGSTVAPSHSYGAIYYQSAHPHYGYKQCTLCYSEINTGTVTTFPHGAASSTKCPLCGDHSYSVDYSQLNDHPHPLLMKCTCGDSYVSQNSYRKECALCVSLSDTAYVYEEVAFTLSKLDEENGIPLPIFTAVRVGLTYDEMYIREGTKFVSVGATSDADMLVVSEAYRYEISALANSRVSYYNSADTEIFYATMLPVNYPLSMDYSSLVGVMFVNNQFPAYSRPGVTAQWDGGLTPAFHFSTATYTY